MNILLSNDDGVYAEGLRSLAQELRRYHHITIVAPEAQHSGMSHAATFVEPVRVRPITLPGLQGVDVYATAGTPADCVRLGCTSLGLHIDLVVSGINHGANLGTHVLYSGTVGAAMEAALGGKAALATSCCAWQPVDFSAAAHITQLIIEYIESSPPPPRMILNLNTPELPLAHVKGIKLAKLHMQDYDDRHVEFNDPYGRRYFFMDFKEREILDDTIDSDVRWVQQGYATLTPIHCDITCETYMRQMDISSVILPGGGAQSK
ncbi:MAG: 5'/3'-nucleotidase SurE [Clostridiales bacterium]|jgi:5'-nucleotidase|nr:5'/3'-nucleotidase SurE [Clostridiales bacterium]